MEKRGRGKAADGAPVEHEGESQVEAGSEALADVSHADIADSWTEPREANLYSRLATPFDVTFRDLRGGVELEYVRRITRR